MKTLFILCSIIFCFSASAQVKSNQYFTVYHANADGLAIDTNGVIIDNCNAYPKMIIKDRVVVFKSQQAFDLKAAELADRRKPLDSLYLDAANKLFLK